MDVAVQFDPDELPVRGDGLRDEQRIVGVALRIVRTDGGGVAVVGGEVEQADRGVGDVVDARARLGDSALSGPWRWENFKLAGVLKSTFCPSAEMKSLAT